MHKVDIAGYKTVEYASCIEELSTAEFMFMMKLLVMQQAGEITIEYFRFMLTMKLLNIKKTVKYYNMPEDKRELVHDNINRLVETIDSFYEYEEENGKLVKKLNLKWIKQMVPRIGRLVGPQDALTNCTFYEYKEAYGRYMQYVDTQDAELIDELIAILYRPRILAYGLRSRLARTLVDERESFTPRSNPKKLAERIKMVKDQPMHVKTAVFTWFTNCVEYLRTGCPVIDGKEINLALLFTQAKEGDKEQAGIGLTGVIYSLAESGVFGNVTETGNTNLYDILVRLYQVKTDFDAMKAKTPKSHDEN